MGQRETSAAATATGTSGRCFALGDPERKGVESTGRETGGAREESEERATEQTNKHMHKRANKPEHNSDAICTRARVRTHAQARARR